MAKTCPVCGKKYDDDVLFCGDDGTKLSKVDAPPPNGNTHHPNRTPVPQWVIAALIAIITLLVILLFSQGRKAISDNQTEDIYHPVATAAPAATQIPVSTSNTAISVPTQPPFQEQNYISAPTSSQPSAADLDAVSNSIKYPKPDEYFSDYRQMYVNSSNGAYALKSLLEGGQWKETAIHVDRFTDVTAIASHSYTEKTTETYYCCIFSVDGAQYAGWIHATYLVDK